MGLKNREGGKTVYVKMKDGKFYLSTDKELETPFEEMYGTITDTYLKDEVYNGIPNRKVYFVLEDGVERMIIGFNVEATMTGGLIGFLKNADLTQPLSFVPKFEVVKKDGQEYKRKSILVTQNGKFLKSLFTKGSPNGLPPMQKIERRGGKVEWVKDEMLDFLENIITNEFKPKVNANKGNVSVVVQELPPASADKKSTTSTLPWDNGEADEDDLPF
jgi:hypothetical protein